MENSKRASYEQGCADARRDIDAGKPRFFYQTRGEWGKFMTQLFRDRFGVEVEHTDCFVWPELVAYRDGYNRMIIEHVDQKHGRGAFKSANAEIEDFQSQWYAKRR